MTSPVADSPSVFPQEIVGLGQTEVRFAWDDGTEVTWPTRAMRLACTCALCISETSGQPLLDPATVPADITVKDMTLVGNYGVNVTFSDNHSTGIYRFRQLALGPSGKGSRAGTS